MTDEVLRASKAWKNMLTVLPRRKAHTEEREKPKAREYRWYTLSDGREVYRPVVREYDLRSHLASPQISADYGAYECPITGKPVEGRAAHRENLKKHGCRVLEPGETRDFKKNRPKERDAKLRRDVSKCVAEAAKEIVW